MTEKKQTHIEAPSLAELKKAGVHFGHRVAKWNADNKSFIVGVKNNVHVFDLEKTRAQLETAAAFIEIVAGQGGKILFVSTKLPLEELIKKQAETAGMPFVVGRWLGGFLTNFSAMKKRIEHLRALEAEKQETGFKKYTKQERAKINLQLGKLQQRFGGVSELKQKPEALLVFDARQDQLAIKEANITGVPVIAIVDTNASPRHINYVISANDDAVAAVELIAGFLTAVMLQAKNKLGESNK